MTETSEQERSRNQHTPDDRERWIEQRRRALEGNPSEFARGYESALDDFENREGEPRTVVWEGALGNSHMVEVDPYAGAIRVNGREFDLSVLTSDDVDPRMYRELNTETGQREA